MAGQAFSVAATPGWNSLPAEARPSESLTGF